MGTAAFLLQLCFRQQVLSVICLSGAKLFFSAFFFVRERNITLGFVWHSSQKADFYRFFNLFKVFSQSYFSDFLPIRCCIALLISALKHMCVHAHTQLWLRAVNDGYNRNTIYLFVYFRHVADTQAGNVWYALWINDQRKQGQIVTYQRQISWNNEELAERKRIKGWREMLEQYVIMKMKRTLREREKSKQGKGEEED